MLVFEKDHQDVAATACALALDTAAARNLDLVASTTTGASARLLLTEAKARGHEGRIIIVTHAFGTAEPGRNVLTDENRAFIVESGAVMITAAHSLSGAERSLSGKHQGVYPVEIIARSLYMLSQGVKVLVEISAMALDAGAVTYGRPVVALAGTGKGLDTAGVLTPAYTSKILDTRIHELLCKPW